MFAPAGFNECDAYKIVPKSKPVFGVEYCDATKTDNGVTQVRAARTFMRASLRGAALQMKPRHNRKWLQYSQVGMHRGSELMRLCCAM